MNPINVSRVVNNPALKKPFQVQRPKYEFRNAGEWTLIATQTFQASAVITPASPADQVKYLPEGQRHSTAIMIFSPTQILMGDGNTQESDVVVWNGAYYRVQSSKPWEGYGYWFAIATGFMPPKVPSSNGS